MGEKRLYQRELNILIKKEIISFINKEATANYGKLASHIALKYGVSRLSVTKIIDMLIEIEVITKSGNTLTMMVGDDLNENRAS